MKAIELQCYGGSEALHIVDREPPTVGPGQVLIQVVATSLNPFDLKRASGVLHAYFPLVFPFIPGSDFSGLVVAIGDGVVGLAIGDAVFGNKVEGGAYAEFLAIDRDKVAIKPANLSHIEAASLALVGQTAMRAVEAARLKPEQTLLMHGIGGAVGTVVTQLLRDSDIRLIGTASSKDFDRLREDGVEVVFDRNTQFENVVSDIDVVIDGVGGDLQARSWGVLKPGGSLIALSQPPTPGEAERHGVQAELLTAGTSTERLDRLREVIEAGQVRPRVSKVYPLKDIRLAWKQVDEDRSSGKTVIEVL